MSTVPEQNELQQIAAGLPPLLKEYTEKLQELSTRVRSLRIQYAQVKQNHLRPDFTNLQHDFDNLRFQVNMLLPPAHDLVQQTSQMVVHGKIDTLARLELALRLAEFEGALQEAQQRISAGLEG